VLANPDHRRVEVRAERQLIACRAELRQLARDRVKILTWDSGGFVLTYKRLEQGRFRLPAFHDGALGAHLDATQFTMLLDGIDVSRVRRPNKWSPKVQVGDRQAPESLINTSRWHPARTGRLSTTASGASGRSLSKVKSRRSTTRSPRSSKSSRR